ncbi:hypothetical protein FRB98_007770 [Tulasnella sp. 332]|nr:hypothetical protein FRB98_007770 [Tulasnella sp. 332]
MSPLEHISFGGKDTENVTLFLQSVKRVAFAQGRQRDQEWQVDYVETCLSDKALLWYITLEQKTRSDFHSLRVAMIEHFAIPTDIPPAPAPAAALIPSAATPAASAFPAPISSPQTIKKQRGRITVVRNDGRAPGYCGPERNNEARKGWGCDRTSSSSEALVVELCQSSDSFKASRSLMKIVSAGGTAGDVFLGVVSFSHKESNDDFWVLGFCDEGITKPYSRSTSLKAPTRDSASKIWAMDDVTGELCATWTGSVHILALRVNTKNSMWLRSTDSTKTEDVCRAKMYFEPL